MQKFTAKWSGDEGAVGKMHYRAMRCNIAVALSIFSHPKNQELTAIPHSQLKDGEWRHVTGTDFFPPPWNHRIASQQRQKRNARWQKRFSRTSNPDLASFFWSSAWRWLIQAHAKKSLHDEAHRTMKSLSECDFQRCLRRELLIVRSIFVRPKAFSASRERLWRAWSVWMNPL